MNNRKFKTILIYCLINILDHFKNGRIRLDKIGFGHVRSGTVWYDLLRSGTV